MLTKETRKQYSATIGIECHVQLKTSTKLFSAVGNDARQAEPNTLISHIDLGMPGALPVLNEKAVQLAIRAAFALGTKPQTFSRFDRKHYFYPDLPKGYQITQYEAPVIIGGQVEIEVDGKTRQIGITRAHLEEDAGKTTHPGDKDYSLVDLNRAGTPLIEIVSEPDIHSPAEAKAYARELWLLMRYAGVTEGDLYHGNMRFDVNVSVSKNDELGTRTETKNLNSFRSVEKAAEYEINRQIDLLEKGQSIALETRGWDDAKQKTFSQRSKEEAHDYRYFPDPDIPPIEIKDSDVKATEADMPELPNQLRSQLRSLKLNAMAIETLLDEMPAGQLIMGLLKNKSDAQLVKKIAHWLVGDIQAFVVSSKTTWDELKLDPAELLKLAEMASQNQISSTSAKKIILEMVKDGGRPEKIAEKLNLLQVSDEQAITDIVKTVLAQNPKAATDIKNGETKAIGFLVGEVMKASKGQANPGLAQSLIKRQLGI